MKKISYLYHSDFLPHSHEQVLRMIQDIAKEKKLTCDFLDVKYMSTKIWKEYIKKWGLITTPMICLGDRVFLRQLPESKQELSARISLAKHLPCQADSILLY